MAGNETRLCSDSDQTGRLEEIIIPEGKAVDVCSPRAKLGVFCF